MPPKPKARSKSIDKDNLTITLSDGKSYKLPGEFDVDALKEGMDVILAYDQSAARTSSPTWNCQNRLEPRVAYLSVLRIVLQKIGSDLGADGLERNDFIRSCRRSLIL